MKIDADILEIAQRVESDIDAGKWLMNGEYPESFSDYVINLIAEALQKERNRV